MKELIELGSRAERERIAQNLRQTDLAEKAAVALNGVRRLEKGQPVRTDTLVRILNALGFQDALPSLLPKPVISPLDYRKLQGKTRKRVR
ncbi:MAG: helix-turn-helix domain-containing protein [Verrucomicrobiota bacterium]